MTNEQCGLKINIFTDPSELLNGALSECGKVPMVPTEANAEWWYGADWDCNRLCTRQIIPRAVKD
jgi:hypothetical protein